MCNRKGKHRRFLVRCFYCLWLIAVEIVIASEKNPALALSFKAVEILVEKSFAPSEHNDIHKG